MMKMAWKRNRVMGLLDEQTNGSLPAMIPATEEVSTAIDAQDVCTDWCCCGKAET